MKKSIEPLIENQSSTCTYSLLKADSPSLRVEKPGIDKKLNKISRSKIFFVIMTPERI